MRIIVGLGNPGKEYEKTRHNVGFMVVDEISKQTTDSSKQWRVEKKFEAEICQFNKDTLLVKPQTFMNDSGRAVKAILGYYDSLPTANSLRRNAILSDLWVIHDDLDLELGRIKIHPGGSSGHHGIESIIKEIGTADFLKFRLGIGRPKEQKDIDFLLSPFTKEELIVMKPAISQMAKAVTTALEQGVEKTMNEFNK